MVRTSGGWNTRYVCYPDTKPQQALNPDTGQKRRRAFDKMASQVIRCPMCQEYTAEERNLDIPDYENYRVKSGSGYISFNKATEGYVRDNFPSFARRTYRVPPMLSYNHDDWRLDFKRDDELTEKEKEAQIHRQQKDSVELVAQAIWRWGEKESEAMFIVSEFAFPGFLKHLRLAGTVDGTTTTVKRRDVHVCTGEHDILVINMTRGIAIFVQVKSITPASAKKTRRRQLTKAMDQCVSDVEAFKSMNRDLPFVQNMGMISLAAAPNLTDDDLEEVYVCPKHRHITLTASHLLNDEDFSKWWEGNLEGYPRAESPAMSEDDYCKLTGRYVGLASVIGCRLLAEAIDRVGTRICRYGVVLPTPEQKEILDDQRAEQRKKVICGDHGTGKTLLLVKKAEELAKRDVVYVISFSRVDGNTGQVLDKDDDFVSHLRSMLVSSSTDESSNLEVISFVHHLKAVGAGPPREFPFQVTPGIIRGVMEKTIEKHSPENVHFFFDELPRCIGKHGSGWKDFEKFCSELEYMHVWIAFSGYSYQLVKAKQQGGPEIQNGLPSFSVSHLTRCMRMTRKGFKLVCAVREFHGGEPSDFSECGNAIDGLEPRWYELAPCRCARPARRSYCKCLGKVRLRNAIGTIIRDIGALDPGEICIILRSALSDLPKTVVEACESLHIDYNFKVSGEEFSSKGNRNMESRTKIVNVGSFKGNESKVVIYIDPHNGQLLFGGLGRVSGAFSEIAGAFSRSTTYVNYITWPPDEVVDLPGGREGAAKCGKTLMEYLTSSKRVMTKAVVENCTKVDPVL